MLSNCGRVSTVRGEDLISSIDVVLLYQLIFVLIEIFSVWYFLLKCLISETSKEVLLKVRGWSGRRPVM